MDITAEIPPGPGESGSVVGSVGGKDIDLRINQSEHAGAFPASRLTGTFSGPLELLALVVGAVAYFAS